MKILTILSVAALLGASGVASANGVQRPVSLYPSGKTSGKNVPAPHRFTPAPTQLLQDPARRPAAPRAADFSES